MELKVRFRPENAQDYPELTIVIKLDENTFGVTSWVSDIDKERQQLEVAVKKIREKLPNHDIISVERLY